MVMNSLSFYLSEKTFVSSPLLKDTLSRFSGLVGSVFFPLSTLHISSHNILAFKVPAETLYVTSHIVCFLSL